jgi:CRP/FNR family cyclic AMP-dependent transcriptional regulator
VKSILLTSLEPEERDVVIAAARKRLFGPGDVVFHQGDPPDSLYLVTSGHLAVQVSTPDGDLALLNVLGPGTHFGELSLLRDQLRLPRSATVLALDAVETLVITRSAFHQLCERHPPIERLVASLMAARIRHLSAELLRARYVGLERRLANSLLDLVAIYEKTSTPAVIPLTQNHIADLVGGTRPPVNQALKRLAAAGVVELRRGQVVVLDLGELALRAGR